MSAEESDTPTKEDRHKDSSLSQHPVRGPGLEEAEECSISLLSIYYKIGQEEQEVEMARGNKGRASTRKQSWIKMTTTTTSQLQVTLLGNCRLLGGKSCQPLQSKAVVAESIFWESTCITVAILCDVTTFGWVSMARKILSQTASFGRKKRPPWQSRLYFIAQHCFTLLCSWNSIKRVSSSVPSF